MAAGIVHRFVTAVPDGGNAAVARPSNWNDTHTIAGQTRGDTIVADAAAEWDRKAVGAAGTIFASNGTDPSWSANLSLTGYGRLGSSSAPSNTTAGDLTIVRLFAPTISMSPTNASGATGTITSTTHATKGHLYIGASTLFDFDEANGQLLIPTVGSGAGVLIGGDVLLYRGAADVLYSPDSVRIGGHERLGSTTAPTNTTAGDLTVVRLKVGDGAFGSGIEFSVTGDGAFSGILGVGSETAPTNTTAGDATFVRVFAPTISLSPTNASGATGTLTTTTHATKGKATAFGSTFDEANKRLGVNEANPDYQLKVTSGATTAAWKALALLNTSAIEWQFVVDTTPTYALSLGTGTFANALVINGATGAVRMAAYGAGTATFDASGNITSVSDERLKTGIRPFERSWDALMGITPILHRYMPESGLDTEHEYAGFSAQNVRDHIPEAVGVNSQGHYTLSDRPILGVVVNVLREVMRRIETLEARN
jgi:hypothetical protein